MFDMRYLIIHKADLCALVVNALLYHC